MNRTLQKILLSTLLWSLSCNLLSAQNNVGVGTRTPNKDAILELFSANKGLLQPRVALVSTQNPAPLTQHVAGMRVYNTATQNDVTPGEYYNDGVRWNRLQTVGSKEDLTKKLSANFEISGTGSAILPGLSFTAKYKGTYLLLIKEFFGITTSSGSDFINWYTLILKNGSTIDANETYRWAHTPWHTNTEFFVTDLEVGDNIQVQILKPYPPHTLSQTNSGLFNRTSLTAVKIF